MQRTGVDPQRVHFSGWRVGLWLMLCLVLMACGGTATDTSTAEDISWEELPIGLGRGYLVAGLEEETGADRPLQQGELAPNFTLQTADGRQLSLQDLQGSPVVINFWATWCGPCRSEMPELVKAAKANPTLRVLAVNVQEELEQIEPFAEDFQMEMPIVQDADGALRDLYAVGGLPTTIFIDKKGKVALVWPGELNKDLLQEFLGEID